MRLVDGKFIQVGTILPEHLSLGSGYVPTLADDVMTLSATQSLVEGYSVVPKEAAEAATTGPIDLLNPPVDFDGVALVDGLRVLVKDQVDPIENGVYDYNQSTTNMERSTDFDDTPTTEVMYGTKVWIDGGVIYKGSQFFISGGTGDIVVDTDPITFSISYQIAAQVAGQGISITGNAIQTKISNGLGYSGADAIQVVAADGTINVAAGGISVDLSNVATTLSGAGTVNNGTAIDIGAGIGIMVNASDIDVDGATLSGLGVTWGANTFDLNITDASVVGTEVIAKIDSAGTDVLFLDSADIASSLAANGVSGGITGSALDLFHSTGSLQLDSDEVLNALSDGTAIVGTAISVKRTAGKLVVDDADFPAGFSLVDGEGTTANGSAVDFGGTFTTPVDGSGSTTNLASLSGSTQTASFGTIYQSTSDGKGGFSESTGAAIGMQAASIAANGGAITNTFSGFYTRNTGFTDSTVYLQSGDGTNLSRIQVQNNTIIVNATGSIGINSDANITIDTEADLRLQWGTVWVESNGTAGLVYSQNLVATFTDESVVSKRYVDEQISGSASGLNAVLGISGVATKNYTGISDALDINIQLDSDNSQTSRILQRPTSIDLLTNDGAGNTATMNFDATTARWEVNSPNIINGLELNYLTDEVRLRRFTKTGSDEQSLIFSAGAMTVVDDLNTIGLVGDADFSGTANTLAYAQQKFVTDAIASSSVTLTDGIGTTANGSSIDLGGVITSSVSLTDTTATTKQFLVDINASGNYSRIQLDKSTGDSALSLRSGSSSTSGGLDLSNGSAKLGAYNDAFTSEQSIEFTLTSMLVTDTTSSVGLEGAAYYGASLGDNKYAQQKFVTDAITAGSFTLTNGEGTTANGTAVDLGGTMATGVDLTGSGTGYMDMSDMAYLSSYNSSTVGSYMEYYFESYAELFTFGSAGVVDETRTEIKAHASNVGTAKTAMSVANQFVLAAEFYLDTVEGAVYNNSTITAEGIRYTGFGETSISVEGAVNYSGLTFNALVPRKYVDDAITTASFALVNGLGTTANGSAVDLNISNTAAVGSEIVVKIESAGSNVLYIDSTDVYNLAIPSADNVDRNLTPSVTTGDDADSGLTITSAPKGLLIVSVSSFIVEVGNGIKTGRCYFSGDNGATAKTIANIAAGDKFYWNGVVNGADLATTDRISFIYI